MANRLTISKSTIRTDIRPAGACAADPFCVRPQMVNSPFSLISQGEMVLKHRPERARYLCVRNLVISIKG